jgi:hypothetical protein
MDTWSWIMMNAGFDSEEKRMKRFKQLAVLSVIAAVLLMMTLPAVAADTANVAGEWALTVETPNGTGTPSVIFKQDGESLTGTYKGRLGEAPINVTLSVQGQDLEIEYSGTVDGDSMKGKAKFGDFGEGNFTGKRAAAGKLPA